MGIFLTSPWIGLSCKVTRSMGVFLTSPWIRTQLLRKQVYCCFPYFSMGRAQLSKQVYVCIPYFSMDPAFICSQSEVYKSSPYLSTDRTLSCHFNMSQVYTSSPYTINWTLSFKVSKEQVCF